MTGERSACKRGRKKEKCQTLSDGSNTFGDLTTRPERVLYGAICDKLFCELSPDAQTDDCNDDCGVWASCGGSHRDETVGCTAGFDDADVASGNCDVADFADGNCGAGAGKADCDDTGVAEVDVMAGVETVTGGGGGAAIRT